MQHFQRSSPLERLELKKRIIAPTDECKRIFISNITIASMTQLSYSLDIRIIMISSTLKRYDTSLRLKTFHNTTPNALLVFLNEVCAWP